MSKIKATGGVWSRAERHIYFCPSAPQTLMKSETKNALVAINELTTKAKEEDTLRLVERGSRVLIDSGVFWLANEHAKAHGISMDKALGLPPEEIDGFDALLERYKSVMSTIGERAWGYIEFDQGGAKVKRKTRAMLESIGLRPIPVYHPLVDGWDYFDEIASQYDRICLGNLVQADSEMRKRILSTVWQRRLDYPHLWIHALGLTPNEICNAYPMDSADSSTWLRLIRWASSHKASCALKPFSELHGNWSYDYDAPHEGDATIDKAFKLGAFDGELAAMCWRALVSDYTAADLPPNRAYK
jgi:hypothetical protein